MVPGTIPLVLRRFLSELWPAQKAEAVQPVWLCAPQTQHASMRQRDPCTTNVMWRSTEHSVGFATVLHWTYYLRHVLLTDLPSKMCNDWHLFFFYILHSSWCQNYEFIILQIYLRQHPLVVLLIHNIFANKLYDCNI
ncbi:hypothetical protein PAHAL_1G094700 [Panicum hallii]|jgi:hypothetical protein|uniref:Uncharacterized protein n=1 Tax=Panicum hallii TaxID=206008 RepID=A0A2T8KUM5_9POAL|nr:hypothetical protein PAHAL_1G094700 [Panicum hallii]